MVKNNKNNPLNNQVHEKKNLAVTDLKHASDGFDDEYEGVADETEDDGQHLGEQHGAALGQLHLHPVLKQVPGKQQHYPEPIFDNKLDPDPTVKKTWPGPSIRIRP